MCLFINIRPTYKIRVEKVPFTTVVTVPHYKVCQVCLAFNDKCEFWNYIDQD